MKAGPLSAPIEILHLIAQVGGLSLDDLKTLRLVHSALASVFVPVIFQRVGFDLDSTYEISMMSKSPEDVVECNEDKKRWKPEITRTAKTKMENLHFLKASEMAKVPRAFFIKIRNNTSNIPIFIEWFVRTRGELEAAFPNIKLVELDAIVPAITSPQGTSELMCAFKEYSQGKRVVMRLGQISCGSPEYLLHVPSQVTDLSLTGPGSDLDSPMWGITAQDRADLEKHMRQLLGRCNSIRSLQIYGFHGMTQTLFDEMSDEAMVGIEILELSKDGNGYDYRHPVGNWKMGLNDLWSKTIVSKLAGLKKISVEVPQSATLDKGTDALWDGLLAASVRLESLKVRQTASNSLFTYLARNDCTLRMQELRLDVRVCKSNDIENRDGTRWTNQQEAERWGEIIFTVLLPNIQGTIRHLELSCNYAGLRGSMFRDEFEGFARGPDGMTDYALRCEYLSFLDRGLSYHFRALESLSVTLFWESGRFDDFMRIIEDAPRLKTIEVHIWAQGTRRSNSAEMGGVYSEILNWRAPASQLRDSIGLEVRVTWMPVLLTMSRPFWFKLKAGRLEQIVISTLDFIRTGRPI